MSNSRVLIDVIVNPLIKENPMQYLLLIYGAESIWEGVGEAEHQKIYGQYRALREELQKAGKYIGGSQLQPVSTGATVRVNNGKKEVTDGPFAETKEVLGGICIITAPDLDTAVVWGGKLARATTLPIEVRPFLDEI